MSVLDDLVPWLRQQIAEKRRRAMATAFLPDGPAPAWTYDRYRFGVTVQHSDGYQVGVASRRAGAAPGLGRYEEDLLDSDGQHMELNDPQAAIAECDAHTAILDLHFVRSDGRDLCNEDSDPYPCGTVRALGLAHQHRAGYREEWRWRP